MSVDERVKANRGARKGARRGSGRDRGPQGPARGKRRTKTAHPGVKLKEKTHRSGAVTWVARWTDPDDGRACSQSMAALGVTNAEARRAWAKRKAEELLVRKRELANGAPRHTGFSLADAFDLYFREADISPSTRENYKGGADRFLAWCGRQGLRLADDLYPEHLAGFRAALRAEPARRAVKGGRRGQKASVKGNSSAATTNNRLRGVKAILNELRRRGLLPHLDRDALTDRLKLYKEPRPRPAFLKPQSLRKLLEAAGKHDAETFVMTREERSGEGCRGTTPKHEPISPFVLLALLGGPRLEELLGLRWDQTDLESAAGVLELEAEDTKTGYGREVWLDVTPSLKRLLLALKLKAEGPYVFGGETPWTKAVANKARRRLIDKFGAPEFTWSQRHGRTPSLRATCATYAYNAHGIWGDASHFAASRRLGHSVAIGERRYAGRHRVKRDAQDLEQAMEIQDAIAALVDKITGKAPAAAAV